MTEQEHEMFLLLFAKYQEALETIIEILKQREIVTADDVNAFLYAKHYDDEKRNAAFRRARQGYVESAQSAGVPLPETFQKES